MEREKGKREKGTGSRKIKLGTGNTKQGKENTEYRIPRKEDKRKC